MSEIVTPSIREAFPPPSRFVLIEDSEADASLLRRLLLREWPSAEVRWVSVRTELLEVLSSRSPDGARVGIDAVLCDFQLPGLDAWESLRRSREAGVEAPFLVWSGAIGEEVAVELIKAGAADVIPKSQLGRVVPAIRRALREREGERRQAEARAQAEAAIRAREETLAVVSHDLRSPLATIQLVAQLQIDRLRRGSPPGADDRGSDELLAALTRIRRASGFMKTLIEDLLARESPPGAATDFPLSRAETDLPGLLRELVEMFEPIAREKGIALALGADGAPPTAWVDRDRVFQALANILSNAVKFSPARGRVRILGAVGDGGRLQIEIEDSGPGVPEEVAPRIFDKYFQGREGDRRGVGLGLHIARTVIERHGGTIEVRRGDAGSDPLGGALFRVSLPGFRAPAVQIDPGGAPARERPARLLFVDDDDDLRQVIAEELRREGYDVVERVSLAEAREALAGAAPRPDLILMDYRLPDGKGAEIVPWLRGRADPAGAAIPVVLLSAELEIAEIAHPAGVAAFLTKPPRLPELLHEVRRLLGQAPRVIGLAGLAYSTPSASGLDQSPHSV